MKRMTFLGIVLSIIFLAGMGVYFGVRLKTTTAAVAATVGSYLVMVFLFRGIFSIFFGLFLSVTRIAGAIWIARIRGAWIVQSFHPVVAADRNAKRLIDSRFP